MVVFNMSEICFTLEGLTSAYSTAFCCNRERKLVKVQKRSTLSLFKRHVAIQVYQFLIFRDWPALCEFEIGFFYKYGIAQYRKSGDAVRQTVIIFFNCGPMSNKLKDKVRTDLLNKIISCLQVRSLSSFIWDFLKQITNKTNAPLYSKRAVNKCRHKWAKLFNLLCCQAKGWGTYKLRNAIFYLCCWLMGWDTQ